MPDPRDKRVELILQQLEALPTLPAVAVRVLQATGEGSSASAADVVRLIGSDPALTGRILQLTRRSDRGVRDEITTIDRAVVLLGFEAVRNAVLAVSVFQALGGAGAASEGSSRDNPTTRAFSREGFWTHSLAVACCAELLAEAGGGTHGPVGVAPAEAFLCGLLHDLGKLALDVALPKSYARVVEAAELLRGDIADLERTVIGVDHLVAGKRLAERWQLPASVRDAIWLHGQPPAAVPAAAKARLVNLVTLADVLVRQQHLGYSGNHAFPVARDELLAAARLTPAKADQAVAKLVARMEPRSAALGLGQATSDDLYRQAIARANRELARVGGQLAAKAKKAAQRAKFFDVLRQFQDALRPDATTQQALSAVAAAGAAYVGADRVAAFSLPPGRDWAEAVLCDADGAVLESTLVELPGVGDLTAGGDGVTEEELAAAKALARGAGPVGTSVPGAAVPTVPLAASQANAAGSATPRAATLPTPAPSPQPPIPPSDSPDRPPAPDADPTPVLPAGDDVEWFTGALSPKLAGDRRFWVCLAADGACVGGVAWAAAAGEPARLAAQAQELSALAHAWALALRSAQARDEARALAEDLAAANRRLSAVQDAVLRTRALTTVGEMAAGAAHEMNNPLAVISGRSQLLTSQLTDPKQKAAAALVAEQADRLSDIITEMMAFAKPQPPAIRPVEVGHLLSLAVTRAKEAAVAADRNIEVTVGDTPLVGVDAGQVAEALAEVIANALQATAADAAAPDSASPPNGAAATPGAAPRRAGRVVVSAGHDPWSGQVAIAVADDGVGMDGATLRRAFDPFYSGKRAGRRRGLGLSKALRWVEASGGTIRLDSRLGVGTRAVVLLPVASANAAAAPDGRPAAADTDAGGEGDGSAEAPATAARPTGRARDAARAEARGQPPRGNGSERSG